MLDWNDLRTLGEVSRHGTLVGAAGSLGLHPTTVGRRLTALEQAVGQRLVVREGRRGVSLTSAGRELVTSVLPLLDTLDGIAHRALGAGGAPVRVAATPHSGRLLASRMDLAGLHTERIPVELVTSNRPVDLTRGEAELAVRLTDVDQPTLVRRRLGVVRYGLFAADAYLVQHPLADSGLRESGLAGHRVLLPSLRLATGPEARWLALNAFAANVSLRASDHLVLAEAAARGEGLAVLSTSLADFFPLRCLKTLDEMPRRVVWLVYHQDLRRDARVQRVALEVARVMQTTLTIEA
ncbi:MAG: LysR family transcriptional regulator [Myxococcota bacterium]